MKSAQIEEAASLFKTLSEPSRLRLVRELMEKPSTVGELAEATGMKQGNVSKHLGILYAARLLGREREGNFTRYRVVDSCLAELCTLVCGKIERDIRLQMEAL